jgi:hypothetical protein
MFPFHSDFKEGNDLSPLLSKQNYNMKIGNRSSENVAELQYFGMTITNQNFIHEKIKIKLNMQNLLPPHLLPECVKLKYTNVEFTYIFMGMNVSFCH